MNTIRSILEGLIGEWSPISAVNILPELIFNGLPALPLLPLSFLDFLV